jgi:GNAT superfamily N-acetyltransferase
VSAPAISVTAAGAAGPATPPARDVRIRPSTERDLPHISALFTPPLDVDRLRWLLSDPARGSALRSLVAEEGDRVVGHVGYTLSRFQTPRGELTGLFCVNWVVDASCRGLGVGSRLFESTFPLADFAYEYGGTEFSHKLFLDMGFEQTFALDYLLKVLRPRAYAKTLGDRWPRRMAKAMVLAGLARGGCRWWQATARDLALAPHQPRTAPSQAGPPARVEVSPGDCVTNITPDDQVAWYLRCPSGRTAAFTITERGVPIGTALCLVRDHPRGARTGRIVHLSYLGEDIARWRGAVALLESWLAAEGCAAVSVFAAHPHFLAALADRGFARRDRTPFWLRERAHGLPRTGWHLTGLEGDIGDRRL